MTDITSAQTAPQTSAEYEAAFERLMTESESINEQMRRDRVEIERLKAETKTIRDNTHTLLAGIDATQAQWEQKRDRDIAVCDQENMVLRAENDRLRSACGLPLYGDRRLF